VAAQLALAVPLTCLACSSPPSLAAGSESISSRELLRRLPWSLSCVPATEPREGGVNRTLEIRVECHRLVVEEWEELHQNDSTNSLLGVDLEVGIVGAGPRQAASGAASLDQMGVDEKAQAQLVHGARVEINVLHELGQETRDAPGLEVANLVPRPERHRFSSLPAYFTNFTSRIGFVFELEERRPLTYSPES